MINLRRRSYLPRLQSLNNIRHNSNSIWKCIFRKDKQHQSISYEFNQRKISNSFIFVFDISFWCGYFPSLVSRISVIRRLLSLIAIDKAMKDCNSFFSSAFLSFWKLKSKNLSKLGQWLIHEWMNESNGRRRTYWLYRWWEKRSESEWVEKSEHCSRNEEVWLRPNAAPRASYLLQLRLISSASWWRWQRRPFRFSPENLFLGVNFDSLPLFHFCYTCIFIKLYG